jgi:hypothetical protein
MRQHQRTLFYPLMSLITGSLMILRFRPRQKCGKTFWSSFPSMAAQL